MKILSLFAVLLTSAVLIYSTLEMPDWGDPNSPPHQHVSVYYLENSLRETATPNVITSVLADYRGYDTLGETVVIFTAAIVCILLLRDNNDKASRECDCSDSM